MCTSILLLRKSSLLLTVLWGGIVLAGCSAPSSTLDSTSLAPPAGKEAIPSADQSGKNPAEQPGQQLPVHHPQLVKKAAMSLIVNSVDDNIKLIQQIISQQQGDLISLDEKQPTTESSRQTAYMQIRVPQNQLESTLEAIAKLGMVENRNITAEDVGDRLVDLQARLTNLRKTEANIQKIMDRAGSVKEVLNVSEYLSNTRQSIEEIDAALQNLKNQVTYSTITLNLEANISSSPQPNIGSQIQETWKSSTSSLGGFTLGLCKFGIWLFVYSPYIVLGGFIIYRFKPRHIAHPLRLVQTEKSNDVE